jgi:cell division control protein 45
MNGDESISMSRKRGSLGDNGGGGRGKRRRLLREVLHLISYCCHGSLIIFPQRPKRMSRDQRDEYQAILDRHYQSGNWHGQSASGTIYVLANVMERVDNDLLWYCTLFCPCEAC